MYATAKLVVQTVTVVHTTYRMYGRARKAYTWMSACFPGRNVASSARQADEGFVLVEVVKNVPLDPCDVVEDMVVELI